MKRTVLFLAVIFILIPLLLIAGTGLFLAYGDLSQFKPQLETAISEATGREFRISGEFKLDLLPQLSVTMEDVMLANAEWSESDLQARIGHFSTDINLRELLSGHINIDDLELRDISLLFENGPQGQSNIDFIAGRKTTPPAQEQSSWDATSFDVQIKAAEISNLTLRQRSPDSPDTTVTVDTLEASTDPTGNLRFDTVAAIESAGITAQGSIGPLSSLIGAAPVNIKLDGSLTLDSVPTEAFQLVATVDQNTDRIKFDITTAEYGKSDLQGELQIALSEPLQISGRFNSRQIDLTPFETNTKVETDSQKDGGELLFTNDPIDTSVFNDRKINVNIAVNALRSRLIELKDIEAQIILADAKLDLSSSVAIPAGGTAHGTMQLDTAQETPELAVKANANDLRINLMSGAETAAEYIPPTDVSLDIASRGESAHTLAASTNGYLHIKQGAGRIENKIIDTVSSDLIAQLFSALNPFGKQDPYSNLECAKIDIAFNNGKGTFKELLAQSEKMQIVGEGDVDLGSEKINIKFNTKPRAGVGISADMLVTPFVRLAGTLKNPSVGLNKAGTALTTGAAIASGGLSLVAKGVADRVTAEIDRCAESAATEPTGLEPPLNEPD